MAAGEQYFRLAVQFGLIIVVSRLLTPAEIGVSVIGMGIITIALGLREFATSDFLIQRPEVLQSDVRTSFTTLTLLSVLISAAVFILAPWFGSFYGEEKLTRFLRVAAVAGMIETISLPLRGLLRREMAFGTLAFINVTAAAVAAATTIVLAFMGFSFMSFAWATVAAACTTTTLFFCFRPNAAVLQPSLKAVGGVLSFGGYNGASYLINQIYVALPQLILGHMLPHSAVGLYNRAQSVSDIPDRIVLTSVFSIAFPALAAEIRQGRSLKEPYLRGLGLITVFYWPGQVLLALLAYPIVAVLLGQQWLDVALLLQLMAVAGLAWFPVILTSPILLAVGANSDRVKADLFGRSASAVVLCSAAYFGIIAMAASKLITLPYQMVLSLYFVRRHIGFRWGDIWMALWKSGIVTICSAAGPICVVVWPEFSFDLSMLATILAVGLAGVGWLVGVLATRHPVVHELRRAAMTVRPALTMRRWPSLRGRTRTDLKVSGGTN